MADQTEAPQVPAAPAAPAVPPIEEGTGQPVVPVVPASSAPVVPPPAVPPVTEPVTVKNDLRNYGVYEAVSLDMSSAAASKASMDQLKTKLAEGQTDMYVLVRLGKVMAGDPRSAVKNLGQARPIDADCEIVADSSWTSLPNVKTQTRVEVSIG